MSFADTILFNGKITTMDPDQPEASAVAIKDGDTLLALILISWPIRAQIRI